MSNTSRRPNLFFRLVIVAVALFILTIFALIAVVFGDPNAPVAQFLNRYAGILIAGEVAAILLLGLLALTIDRRQSLEDIVAGSSPPEPNSDADESEDSISGC